MFDNIPSTKPIPMDIKSGNSSTISPHWCYDAKTAGVRSSRSMSFSSPSSSFMSQSPTFGVGSLGSGGNGGAMMKSSMNGTAQRRNSLKNMVHLCDFATP